MNGPHKWTNLNCLWSQDKPFGIVILYLSKCYSNLVNKPMDLSKSS